MKRYVAAITGMTKADEQRFLGFIKENRWGWWHRIDNFWLIIDSTEESNLEQIRDFLMPLSGSIGIVLEVPEAATGWMGFGPTSTADEFFSWLDTNWSSD
jgi:hypothetical protein